MKIVVWHNLPSGGGKRALYYQVRGLVERGHQVSCWCLDSADQSYLPLSEFAPERVVQTEFRKPRTGFTNWLAPRYTEAIARMQAFDDACRRCAQEIAAGQFDLLFANSSVGYHVPFILRHLDMRKLLYLQEPCRFLYEAAPVLPWVSGADEEWGSPLFSPRRIR